MYNSECHKLMRQSTSITRYNVCAVACKVYSRALSSENLHSAFRKTGIFPFDKSQIKNEYVKPAEVFAAKTSSDTTNKDLKNKADDVQQGQEMDIEENQDNGEPSDVITSSQNNSMDSPSAFMTTRIEKLIEIKSMVSDKKVRNTISKLTSGKPITEEENVRGIVDHQLNYRKKQPTHPNNSGTKDMIKINKGKQHVKGKGKIKQRNPCKKSSSAENKLSKSACEISQCNSPKPGPSHYYVDSTSDDSASHSDIPDEEKCCICKLYTPKEIREAILSSLPSGFSVITWHVVTGFI